jgi:hypothetical protein
VKKPPKGLGTKFPSNRKKISEVHIVQSLLKGF